VLNLADRTSWPELSGILSLADLVICNNSGIAHQAAALGAPTLAIYSASHQPREWGPRGDHVRTLMAEVACSPCGHDRLNDCPNEHLCMRLITPDIVLTNALEMLATAPDPQASHEL
jgi:ADP-heptose:LPS heptosyltransferase